MEDSSGDKRNSNLARIRDNQRRSRARRKEYLQDLETRYRHCEQTGVEASAEIQAAARKVVDENRRLRELLRQYGVSDAEIDSGPTETRDHNLSNELESMLSARRRCGGGTCDDGSSCQPPSSDALANSTTHLIETRSPTASHLSNNSPAPPFPPSTQQLPTSLHPSHLFPVDASISYTTASPDYPLPSLESYDHHAHLSLNPIPPLPHTGSPLTSPARTASDAEILAAQQEFDWRMEQESCCGGGVPCRIPSDGIYKIMEVYSQGS